MNLTEQTQLYKRNRVLNLNTCRISKYFCVAAIMSKYVDYQFTVCITGSQTSPFSWLTRIRKFQIKIVCRRRGILHLEKQLCAALSRTFLSSSICMFAVWCGGRRLPRPRLLSGKQQKLSLFVAETQIVWSSAAFLTELNFLVASLYLQLFIYCLCLSVMKELFKKDRS